jgi:ribonuclease E
MTSKMLIDATHPEETRVVVVKGNRVEEFDFEAESRKQLRGSIYLAKVTRVEPSLQAAFVEYGGNRHGFLAFSEIHPDYYQIPAADRQALLDEEHEDEIAAAAEDAADDVTDKSVDTQPDADAEFTEENQADPDADDSGDDDPDATDTDQTAALDAASDESVSEDTAPIENDDDHEDGDGDTDASADDGDSADAGENGNASVEAVGDEDALEEVPQRKPRRKRHYKIQEVIKRKQVLLVQVVKEERGNKGAALTTYLSLAGRYCVLMPNTARGGGISRKITSAGDRKRLKDIARELEVPKGMGVILRTAGASRTKPEVRRDFEYLLRLWEAVRTLTLESMAPKLVYEEGNIVKRAIRDIYSKEISEVLVAGDAAHKEARDFMRMLMPSHAKNIQLYKDEDPIFSHYNVEQQLDEMFSAQVTLRSGGYIVINQTEALVAIDVNSGRATKEHSIEDTALKTNLEAAEEIARQLRLRDLAGLVVIDFIDMEENRNNRAVERKMKDCLKTDRARIQVGRISHFGLLEMSRQRIRSGIMEGSFITCAHCEGSGMIRSSESVALQVLRSIEDAQRKRSVHVTVRARPDVAMYILNNKRAHLWDLEQRYGISVTIVVDDRPGNGPFTLETGAAADRPPARPRKSQAAITVNDAHEEVESDTSAESAADDDGDAASAQADEDSDGNGEDGRQRKRRRGRRGGRRRRGGQRADGNGEQDEAENGESGSFDDAADAGTADEQSGSSSSEDSVSKADSESGEAKADDKPKRARKTGRRRVSRKAAAAEDTETDIAAGDDAASDATSETIKEASADTPESASHEPVDAESIVEPETAEAGDVAETTESSVSSKADPDAEPEMAAEPEAQSPPEPPRPRRKGWWQRALSPGDD